MSEPHDHESLDDIIAHENEQWSKIFAEEQQHTDDELYTSYWWEDYYHHITTAIRGGLTDGARVAEIGSGSGKATLLLGDSYHKTLVDISPPAIDFARHLAAKLKVQNVEFSIDNGFDTKLKPEAYDLTWNIGVIEHYPDDKAADFVAEMFRVTKRGGQVAVAVPNFRSYHIKKAQLLAKPAFSWIPGYRLDSEQNYTTKRLAAVLASASEQSERKIAGMKFHRFGNPLPMESPALLVRSVGRVADRALPGCRFLLMALVDVA